VKATRANADRGYVTSRQAWQVGARLLGAYFFVEGLLYSANAIGIWGIVVPEGSRRTGYVSAALLQGAIGIVAGTILMRGKFDIGDEPSTPDAFDARCVGVQLLGVFFAVSGADALARFAAGSAVASASWFIRASELASAAVQAAAGASFIVRPRSIATVLESFERQRRDPH
jgi:hypothetical protein